MRATLSIALITAAALATSACGGGNEARNVTAATEVAPVENDTTSDAMVTGITPAAPSDNAAAPVGNAAEPVANRADNAI
jgi:hypothetical protein